VPASTPHSTAKVYDVNELLKKRAKEMYDGYNFDTPRGTINFYNLWSSCRFVSAQAKYTDFRQVADETHLKALSDVGEWTQTME